MQAGLGAGPQAAEAALARLQDATVELGRGEVERIGRDRLSV